MGMMSPFSCFVLPAKYLWMPVAFYFISSENDSSDTNSSICSVCDANCFSQNDGKECKVSTMYTASVLPVGSLSSWQSKQLKQLITISAV